MIIAGTFAGEPLSEQEEMRDLADALYGGSTIHIDEYGVAHLEDETGTQTNGPIISDGTFAGEPLSEQEEMRDLADALYGGSTIHIDEYGVAHLEDETGTQTNGPIISDGTFAGEPTTQIEEINQMRDALYDEEDNDLEVDANGVVHLVGGPQAVNSENEGARIEGNTFGGQEDREAELEQLRKALLEGPELVLDKDGTVHFVGETHPQESLKIDEHTVFAAPLMPTDPDQWYNKMDHRLFRSEVAAMRKYFPKAGYGFLKSSGNMYWVIDMNISQTGFTNTWRFMLVYDKDHPHNHTFGGSIKVVPIRPNEDDLKKIAEKHDRPGVPHLLHSSSLGTYLCTRRTEDVKDGVSQANTAVSAAAWAADWALHFEIGIRDKKIWNKWCDDEHFRRLKI